MNRNKNTRDKERLLYNRKKNTDVYLLPSGRQFRIVAEMRDGIHQMRLDMIVNQPSLRIKEINCEMPGVPDPICRRAQGCLEPLVGKRVVPGIMHGMDQVTRGGCTHLINLFREACYNLTQAQGVTGREELQAVFPGIAEEQLYKIFFWFRPDMKNSCIRYNEDSPFLQRVQQIQMPEGAEKLRAIAKAK